MNENYYKNNIPEWARKASNITHKPDWQDTIPRVLWEFGEVFFPIPPKMKGWNYPHHNQDFRYSADSEILNAYFDAGWGYGISCADDIIVVDIDDLRFKETILKDLPETAYQVTGSLSGEHHFFFCEGLITRQTLRVNHSNHMFTEGVNDPVAFTHIGEVKCDPHGYVVGPHSLHPSGNTYGPLEGDEITEVDKDVLLDAISEFVTNNTISAPNQNYIQYQEQNFENVKQHQLYRLTADDVAPWLESENRIAHPIHGSSTYEETGGRSGNFMKNEGGETFVCWRCQAGNGDGCVLNARHMLAMEKAHERSELGGGDYSCEWIRQHWHNDPRLHFYAWEKAVERDLVKSYNIPFKVVEGYCMEHGIARSAENITRNEYFDILNSLEWKMMLQIEDIPEPRETDLTK